MPTIATRAAASARGYGFAGIKLNVVSQTFTSSTTWVAPATVTNLLAVIGKGQDGGSDYQGNISVSTVSITNVAGTGGTISLPITWSGVANTAKICANVYTAGGYQLAYHADDREFTFYSNLTASFVDLNNWSAYTTFPYYLVAGTWSLQSYGGAPNPPSGNATYGASGGYYANGDIIYPGGPGANTTGFGYTFTGGGTSGSYPNATGDPATPASYTNVAVTPGASYSLSIPAGGYITIQYLSA